MTRYPSELDIEIAYATLGKLIERGNNPHLNADGRIHLGGPVTVQEHTWAREHRDAFQSALVGSGRYTPGTLDRIYGVDSGMSHPAPNEQGNEKESER